MIALAVALPPVAVIVVAAVLILGLVIVWKMVKVAVKVALIAGVAFVLFLLARTAGLV